MTMTEQEFQDFIAQNPGVARPLQNAAQAMQSRAQRTRSFGLPVETAAVVLLFPLAKYILDTIGLPWLGELRRYSELQRRKAHEWIDANYHAHGWDPDAAEKASDALLDELEATTDARARQSWENLVALLKTKDDSAEG